MSLTDILGKLQQYAAGTADTSTAEQDFEHVAQNAPQPHLAGGLADTFRSNQTPPFTQMISSLFNNSDGQQRAGILSRLVAAAGPAAASGALGGMLGGNTAGAVTPEQAQQVSPEQAQQVSPEAVHDLAQQAEKNNPSIIDEAGSFYAQHPTLIKALGAGALAMVMSHMSQRQS